MAYHINRNQLKSGTTGFITPEMYGAVGDGITDDLAAMQSAFSSPITLRLTPGKTYAISDKLVINTPNKVITGYGATIKKLNNIKYTISLDHVNGTVLQGLKLVLAVQNDGGANPAEANNAVPEAWCIIVFECTNYKIEDCYIDGSWEGGIGNQNCVGGYIHNNTIKNTYRDGIYSQYSANITYEGNHLYNIKDDALSMHDYGIDAQKPEIIAAGYLQAGHSKIINNTVDVAYQGVSSIGCKDLEITGNVIKHTVNAGIAVFTADWEFNGSTATVNHVNIHDNDIYDAGATQTFNGVAFMNQGQSGTGRAAICVISTGANGQFTSATRQLNDIFVNNNHVSYCGSSGIFLANIDRVTAKGNTIWNCSRANYNTLGGEIFDIKNCNDIMLEGNTVIDTYDGSVHHNFGYAINTCSGRSGNWYIKGTYQPSNANTSIQNSLNLTTY